MTMAVGIEKFFKEIYEEAPLITRVKKNILYSLKERNGISVLADSHGGCHVEMGQLSQEEVEKRSEFIVKAIEKLAKDLQSSGACNSLWLNFPVPIKLSTVGMLTPSFFEVGNTGKSDVIFDAQNKQYRAWVWLNPKKQCTIPLGATHNLGATALVCDTEARKILLVLNKSREDRWNLPGGSFEREDKNLSETAIREAQEESGVKIDVGDIKSFQLVGQIEFPDNQFASAINQIWAFSIPGLSKQKLNPPKNEILRAEWFDYNTILRSNGQLEGIALSAEISSPLEAAIHNLGARIILDKKWMIVHAPQPSLRDRMEAKEKPPI